ncbi:MAG: hypothetical protein FJX84_01635 [Bacteroidetes bacterium]|nr:hypothetical protein [Bacteroidota bacterium]
MNENSIWSTTESLLIVLNCDDNEHMKDYKKALDRALNESNVEKLTIVVLLPKEVDKNSMTPHFVIYYISPTDFNFFGRLKDVQLLDEFKLNFDTLIWFGDDSHRIFSYIKKIDFQNKIGVNATRAFFEMHLKADIDNPASAIEFIHDVLTKSYSE